MATKCDTHFVDGSEHVDSIPHSPSFGAGSGLSAENDHPTGLVDAVKAAVDTRPPATMPTCDDIAPITPIRKAVRPSAPSTGRGYRVWSEEEETNLIAGVSSLGIGNWEAIRMNPEFNLSQRSALQLKDKWRNLVKYKHVATREASGDNVVICRKRKQTSSDAKSATVSTSSSGGPQRMNGSAANTDCDFESNPPSTPCKRQKSVSYQQMIISDDTPASDYRSSSPDSYASADENIDRATSSGHGGAESSCSALVERDLSAAVCAGINKVEKAREMMQVAFLILQDANKAVSDALGMAQLSANMSQACEAVKSASYVASLAQQKAWKSRAFLDAANRELAEAQGAVEAAQMVRGIESFTCHVDAEDTADSVRVETADTCSVPEQSDAQPLTGLADCFAFANNACEHDFSDLDKFGFDLDTVLDDIGSDFSEDDMQGGMMVFDI